MKLGYDKPLYVLPFDHRGTFSKNMFGWKEPLNPVQTAEIAALKEVIYDAFKAAIAGGVPRNTLGKRMCVVPTVKTAVGSPARRLAT